MADFNLTPGKTLNTFSLVMINVIAVDSLRTLPIAAEYGFSLIFYYLLAALIFFIPTALVAAELATAWPQTGGLYVWVREAFGVRAGFFTIWLQWIYNVIWYPTIMAFISATLAFTLDPDLANHKMYLLFTNIILFWLLTAANCFGMRISSWISIAGAILGTLLPMLLIIVFACYWIMTGMPMLIEFNQANLLPDISQVSHLVLLIGLLFGLVGIEMSAMHAGDVKNPQTDYPRALVYSTIIILLSLILSSLAIAIVIPQSKLSLVSALLDAFQIFLNAYDLKWMMPLIIILIIFGALSSTSAWIIGPTKGLLIALEDSQILKPLQKRNRYGIPSNILMTQAFIFTCLCSVFILLPSINSSYWLLSAISAQFALLVYVLMFSAAIALRYKRPNVTRPYSIPFGKAGIWIVSCIGIITCLVSCIVGFLPPSQIDVGDTFWYESILVIGMLLFIVPPLMFRIHD